MTLHDNIYAGMDCTRGFLGQFRLCHSTLFVVSQSFQVIL